MTAVGADAQVPGQIASIEPLGGDVLRVRVTCEAPFDYRPRQYITLLREDGLARSYSIASLRAEAGLELHVRCLPNGRMSEWIRGIARAGDRVRVLGPSGDCFYVPGRPGQPLLLAGTGTGLAPLYGIVRDALESGHAGPIHLFHGARHEEGLYLRDALARLAADHPNLEYVPSVLASDGPLDTVILDRFDKMPGWRAFLCGDPALVQALRKKLFLRGMDLKEIFTDAFLPAA